MCGRFGLKADPETIIEYFQLTNSLVLTPRYNIAPSQVIPVIRTVGILDFLTWGFRPKWLQEDQNGFINARIETLADKPAFRNAFKKQRCLIIADGYFEWKQVGNLKQPFYITLPQHKLFAFAGLWEGDTCCLITKPAATEILNKVHGRMPVILKPEHYAAWLDAATKEQDLAVVLGDTIAIELQVIAVSTKVNNPRNDFIECISPLH
jgi:putative SOS response-associated peptidase YedK